MVCELRNVEKVSPLLFLPTNKKKKISGREYRPKTISSELLRSLQSETAQWSGENREKGWKPIWSVA